MPYHLNTTLWNPSPWKSNLPCRLFSESNPAPPGTALGLDILSQPWTAAICFARYISDRFILHKAIDVVDEAASSLRLARESKLNELESLEWEIMTLQIQLESLKSVSDAFSVVRRNTVKQELKEKREEAAA